MEDCARRPELPTRALRLLRDDQSVRPFWYALKLRFPLTRQFCEFDALNGLQNQSDPVSNCGIFSSD